MHVMRVRGNAKRVVDAKLGPCTLVVGANAAGKSGLVETLSLALTGESPELGSKGVDLMALVPDGGKRLEARCDLEDGTEAQFSVTGSTAKASKPTWSSPVQTVLLADAARAILRSDQKKLRAYLLGLVGGEAQVNLDERLPGYLRDVVAGACGILGADGLVALAEQVNDDLRQARASLRALEKERPLQVSPLSEDELRELAGLRELAAQEGMPEAQILALRAQQAEAQRRLVETEGEIRGLEAEVGSPPSAEAHELARQTQSMHALLGRLGLVRRCPVCRQAASPEVMAQAAQDAAEFAGRLEAAGAGQRALQAAQARRETLQGEVAALGRTLARATVAAPVDRARLTELAERQRSVEVEVDAGRRIADLKNREQGLSALADALRATVGDVLDRQADELSARITAGLPAGWAARLVLRDGARSVCRIEIQGFGNQSWRDMSALSGAERAILLAAFCGLTPASPGVLRLVVIDDVWLDRDALCRLLVALRNGVDAGRFDQAIVCAVEGSDMNVPGWTVVGL